MGKNDLKNKVKSASADAARTSLFGSLDDYVSATAAEKESPKDAAPAQVKAEAAAESNPKTPARKSSATARAKTSAPVEPEVTPAEMDDEDLFETYTRKTYFYTQPQIEAIRIMAFNSGLDISQVVRDIMDEAIPDDIMEQAIERVKAGKIKQPRKRRKK